MAENPNPIFDFQPLREFLVGRGYNVKQAQGYRPIKPEVITREQINRGSIDFTNEGIFVVDSKSGERYQVFLYKHDYHLNDYGNPRFHICKCRTIEEFIAGGRFRELYVRANTDPVPVRNLDYPYGTKMVSGLKLCQNCYDVIYNYGNVSSTDFVELLKQANGNQEEHEVDIFGYTKDWETISRTYKEAHNYTCEGCGLRITNLFNRQYIHVHHIDGNKLNNKETNLRCLCLRCHASIDERHHKNLTTGANRHIWEAFMSEYQ